MKLLIRGVPAAAAAALLAAAGRVRRLRLADA